MNSSIKMYKKINIINKNKQLFLIGQFMNRSGSVQLNQSSNGS